MARPSSGIFILLCKAMRKAYSSCPKAKDKFITPTPGVYMPVEEAEKVGWEKSGFKALSLGYTAQSGIGQPTTHVSPPRAAEEKGEMGL